MQLQASLLTLLGLTTIMCVASSAAIPISDINRRTPTPSQLFADKSKRQCSTHSNTWATFYTSGTSSTQTTACGDHYDPNANTVAITEALEKDLNARGIDWCHVALTITSSTGKTVQAGIVDSNATGDLGYYSLDATPAVYDELWGSTTGDTDPGQLKISWAPEGTCF